MILWQSEVFRQEGIGDVPVLLRHPTERRGTRRADEQEIDLELLQDLVLGRRWKLLDHRGGGGLGILPRRVPALQARLDEFAIELGIGLELVIPRDHRETDRWNTDIAIVHLAELEAAIGDLHTLEIRPAEDGVDLLLQERAHQRR